MANNYSEVLALFNAGNKMGLSNTITRDYGIPLDFSSIHASFDDAVIYAATKAIAYQNQLIAAADKAYIIVSTSQGKHTVGDKEYDVYLKELGQATEIQTALSGLNTRLLEVEKFFKATDDLDGTIETLCELQNYIDEHGSDFGALFTEVRAIYTPAGVLKDEKGDPVLDKDGKEIIVEESGLLVDIRKALEKAISDEAKAREAADNIVYDADGGEDGKPSGLLPDEIARAKAAEEALAKKIGNVAETENLAALLAAETKNREDADLAIFTPTKTNSPYDATGQVVDWFNSLPAATADRLGMVRSSTLENYVKIHTNGEMEVNTLNVNKLVQTAGDTLILDGGNAGAASN
jgi:hypothetical protein